MKVPWHKRIYALYKGDENVTDGTIQEISEHTGKSVEYLRWMLHPSYERRRANSNKCLIMVSLDDELD